MMEYDFAIIYFGLTRSVKKTHESHTKHVFDVLKREKLSYKTFMHTWKTKDGTQNVWQNIIPQKIDYTEHLLLSPDFYTIDDENEFLDGINMDNYFYKDATDNIPDGWGEPKMVSNHICMLESQKRAFSMVAANVMKGDKFKFVMFIRPDITIHNELPLYTILVNHDKIQIPNHNHFAGANDQFAILNYEHACIYGRRIDELADFRKKRGRIVGENYCKFIISKYNMEVNELDFQYTITRP
jgi:hypothetical protein